MSDSEDGEARRNYIKPTKLDGSSSFEVFMAQFNNRAEHNKWTQSEKLAQLKSSLVKDARARY
jgi:hypothetical protein